MIEFSRRVVSYALSREGMPYIWGGKGLLCWSPTRPQPMPLVAGCAEGFDCIGLITWAVHAAGGPDVRFTWSCQEAWNLLPEPVVGEKRRLLFFGPSVEHIAHVEIELAEDYVLGAAGGDSSTKTAELAAKRGAKVRVADRNATRTDFRGARSLRAMQFFNPNQGRS